MAYVKTTWQTGDVITAEKLNHAEGGIEAAEPVFITGTVDDGTIVLSEKYEDIKALYDAGRQIYIIEPDGSRAMVDLVGENTLIVPATYNVYCMFYDGNQSEYSRMMFVAATVDDYPTFTP